MGISVRSTVQIDRSSSCGEKQTDRDRPTRREPQEKEDNLTTPTVYSYCRVSINATGCLAWEESKLGCSEEERGKSAATGVDFDRTKLTYYNRSTSMDVGVRGIPEWTRDQVELQGCRSRDELQTRQW
jgi:hypothetical protein